MEPLEDYYAALEIKPTATDAEIKSAYRRMAKDFHPDTVVSASDAVRKMAADKFKAANQAHEVLGDPLKKSAYDRAYRTRSSRGSPAGGSSRTAPPPPPPPPSPPPPRVYRSVITVDQDEFNLSANEGEPVTVSFTVRLVSGDVSPDEMLRVKYKGDFLDSASFSVDPKNSLPAKVTVKLPYAEVGEFLGEIEVVVE